MFIASYATYVPTLPATQSIPTNDKYSPTKVPVDKFNNTLQKKEANLQESTPIVSKYSIFEQARKSKNILLFSAIKTRQDAKNAYAESVQPFSFMKKPKMPQQKPIALRNAQLPKEAQSAQEHILKVQMVNTYIENDNYYRVTAA